MLDQLSEEERFVIILIFWRDWSDRNSITHGGGQLSIDASARALRALQRTFSGKQLNIIDDVKGKFPLNVFAGKQKQKVPLEKQTPKLLWRPPEEGWIKINVDGSYVKATGEASVGGHHSGSQGECPSLFMEIHISVHLGGRSRASCM